MKWSPEAEHGKSARKMWAVKLVPNEVTWEGRLCLQWLNTELHPEKPLSAGRNSWFATRGAGCGGTVHPQATAWIPQGPPWDCDSSSQACHQLGAGISPPPF